MTQCLAGGAAALIGLGLVMPPIVGWREQGTISLWGYVVVVAGASLIAAGTGAAILGFFRPRGRSVPRSVLGAVIVNALFLGLLALEISHGLSRNDGAIAKSVFFFPPALALLVGLLSGHCWAWCLARWGSLLFALLYFAVSIAVCILRPTDQHGPVWIWIAAVSVVLGTLLLAGGFYALGRPSARRHFGSLPATPCG